LKPLPLNKQKEESKASQKNAVEIEKTSNNKVVIGSILEPETMQTSANNFLPKFGVDVYDEEHDPPIAISHQNGTVEDSDSESEEQDHNDDDDGQYD